MPNTLRMWAYDLAAEQYPHLFVEKMYLNHATTESHLNIAKQLD